MLEVSRLGSREQPQLVLSGVCDVLGGRCHTALASLAAGPRHGDSAGDHKATLGGDREAARPHTGVTPQRGHPERGCCVHRGQGRLSGLPEGLSGGAAGLAWAQHSSRRGRRARVSVTLCCQEPRCDGQASSLAAGRWPWGRSPAWGTAWDLLLEEEWSGKILAGGAQPWEQSRECSELPLPVAASQMSVTLQSFPTWRVLEGFWSRSTFSGSIRKCPFRNRENPPAFVQLHTQVGQASSALLLGKICSGKHEERQLLWRERERETCWRCRVPSTGPIQPNPLPRRRLGEAGGIQGLPVLLSPPQPCLPRH